MVLNRNNMKLFFDQPLSVQLLHNHLYLISVFLKCSIKWAWEQLSKYTSSSMDVQCVS